MDVKPYKMTSSKQLNIRIKFAPQKPDSVPEQAAYVYHWQRIIGAALLSITTLALFVYGVLNYLQPAQSNTPGMAVTTEKTHSPSAAMQAAAAERAAPFNEQKNSMLPATEAKSSKQTQADNEAVIAATSNSPAAEPKSTKQAQADNETMIDASNNIHTSAERTRQAAPRFSPVLTHSGSEVFSKHIQPFVITQAVKNRQPVGSINDIKPDVNNIMTVYAYSKVLGLKGETLYYKWRLNGKDIAQVKVKVGSDRWRSYSRKYIQSHMQGDWSVALENGKGEVLAVNRFQY